MIFQGFVFYQLKLLDTIAHNYYEYFLKGQTRIVPGRCSRCSNPCIDQYPSCDGLEDGFQAWPSKPTEYWIICYKKRLLEKGTCKEDSNWKSRTLPYNGTCTSVFAIPGESLPSCAGKPNGNFDTSQFFSSGPWLCNAYYNCKDGVTTAHVCPNGTVFDGKSGECKMGSYAFSAMCQLYCSSLEWSDGYDFSEGMNECEYPQLFSSESATCKNFTDVTCGTRHEEKEGCKYRFKMQRSEFIFFKARFMYVRMCRHVLASKLREEQIFANSKNFIKLLPFMLSLKLKRTHFSANRK